MDCTNKSEKSKAADKKGSLEIIYGDITLGVKGERFGKKFHYIFSYATGGLESLSVNGKEWLFRTPKPTFWRALTDNDRGNRFYLRSGMWLSADMFMQCISAAVKVDGEDIPLPCAPENNKYSAHETANDIRISYIYETITVPATQVEVAYNVKETGEIQVDVHYYGKEGLPELPVFGMRFIMPTYADKFIYEGLSGETYPDRKAGGIPGVYEVEGLPVTPYLVPQDCGMHMDTKWVEVYRSKTLDNRTIPVTETALRFEAAGKEFAFSCLPYTAQELENALHMEELPPARRTVLCIYGAVRGVGGIDSWGADVEPDYHIDAQKDITCSFRIIVS